VTTPSESRTAGVTVELAGPAVIVADLEFDDAWLARFAPGILATGVSAPA
jgi:hypothetical protein